jgi:uncharacterized membrane protein
MIYSVTMKLECNIDQRGRRARLISGVVTDMAGVALVVAGLLADHTGLLVAGIVACVAGAFMIFEGLRGWCVMRALGFKTPM